MVGVDVLCFLCGTAALVACLRYRRRRLGKAVVWLVAACVISMIPAAVTFSGRDRRPPEGAIPLQVAERGYVSSNKCRTCHPDEHRSWHRTFHRTMTQVVTPETVLADFSDREIEYGRRTFRFTRRGDTFWVQDINSPIAPQRVVMSTGSHHYQVYWVQGRYRTQPVEVPIYWNIVEKRWIPKGLTVIHPTDGTDVEAGHWNTHCINCHSTGGVPGFDPRDRSLTSEVAEFGISCEACHGPAREHVRRHQNPLNRFRARRSGEADPTIVNPAKCSSRASTFVCGRCHSNSQMLEEEKLMMEGYEYLPGDEEFEEKLRLVDFDDPPSGWEDYVNNLCWRDGTCRTGGDELNAHIKSPCYQRGELTCLSCHSMHDSDPNDQLAKGMDGNQACLQCHQSYESAIEEHTHHPAKSSGSQCYNCHMPNTTYALSTAMRSHRIDSPSVETSARTGRPNACNLCHLDQTMQWAADRLTDWYGAPAVELDEEQQDIAGSLLWLLKGDAIQRAVVAWHFGWEPALQASGDQWQASFLGQLLEDPYAQVRFLASRSLRNLPGFQEFDYDFIASTDERAAAAAQVLQLWKPPPNLTAHQRDRLLLDAAQGLDAQRVQQLLEQRDDKTVSIPE